MAELLGRHVLLPQSRLPIVAEPDVLVVAEEIDVQQLQARLRRQGAILE